MRVENNGMNTFREVRRAPFVSISVAQQTEPIDCLWMALSAVQRLSFRARSPLASGWNGSGDGTVGVTALNDGRVVYSESGQWLTAAGVKLNFTNVYRWTLLRESQRIRLEHLRFGGERPIHLFEIEPTGANDFKSVEPHVCSEDLYAATLRVDAPRLLLNWRVTGPNTDNTIEYVYG